MAHCIIAALALATTPAVAQAPAPAPVTAAPDPATELVQTTEDRNQRLTVPVLIEGELFAFMVDTGSEATVVTDRVRNQLGLTSAGKAVVVGMASRVSVELVNLDGLEFAARTFDGLEVPLLEARHVGADGILGLDTLQDLRVLIDFKADTIAVNDAEALGGNRGYEIVIRARRKLGRLIITEAMVDNVRTAVIIDTGAQASIGNLALQNKLRARKREIVTNKDVNGFDIVGAMDFARTLRLDGMEINNLPIMFADGPAFAQLGFATKPAMILGMRDLRIFDRVAIDFATRTILFDAPSASGLKSKMNFGGRPSRL